jgi:hypothetical protein
MENIPALNFSTTLPITSIASSFGNFFLYRRTRTGRGTFLYRAPVPNPSLTSGFAASRRRSRDIRRPVRVRPSAELR